MLRGRALLARDSQQCPVVPDILELLAVVEAKTARPALAVAQQPAPAVERKRKASLMPFLKWTNLSAQPRRGTTAIPQPLAVSIASRTAGANVLEAPPAAAASATSEPAPKRMVRVVPEESASETNAPSTTPPAPADSDLTDPLERLELELPASVVRENLKIMVPTPDISEFYVLPSGDEVGKFSVKYLLYLDQKSMRKRRQLRATRARNANRRSN